MPLHAGKIIVTANRNNPGGPRLHASTVGMGLRKCLNLCHACDKFSPRQGIQCTIEQSQRALNKLNDTNTIIMMCAAFVPKQGVEVSDSAKGD